MTIHDDTRIDNYYWMRDDNRADPEIIAHLNAENAYTDAVMAHTEALQQQLFDEIKGRIVKDDNSVISLVPNWPSISSIHNKDDDNGL